MSDQPLATPSLAKAPKKRFRALFSLTDADHLEMILHDPRSHLPRRIALTALSQNSESLVSRYAVSLEALQSLTNDVASLGHYLANQREYIEMITTARDRLAAVRARIVEEHPEILPKRRKSNAQVPFTVTQRQIAALHDLAKEPVNGEVPAQVPATPAAENSEIS